MTVVTDNFNRANENPLGGNWTTGVGNGLKIVSSAVTCVDVAAGATSYWSANSFSDKQYSQIKQTTYTNGFNGPAVRCATTNAYIFFYNSGTSEAYLSKYISGSQTNLLSMGSTSAVNDVLKLEADGTTLTGYKNNSFVLSTTDGSLSSGSPGLRAYYQTDDIMDDFEGGDIVPLTSIYPISSIGTSQSSTANQSSFTVTTTNEVLAGNLIVLIVACDNNQTTDGDEGAVSSVTDSAGNTWTKGAEFTNGQGSAQAGATCSIWWCQVKSALASSSTITVNLTNNTSRDKTCSTAYSFYAPGTISLEGTPGTLANDGADPGSLNVTTIDTECLRVRGIAAESNSTTAITTTSSWTAFAGNQTTGGGSAGNMAVRGEFIISNGTSSASDPTLFSADCASVYIALKASGAITKPLFKRRPYTVRI